MGVSGQWTMVVSSHSLHNQGILHSWKIHDTIFRDRTIYTSYFEPADTVSVTTFMPCEQITWQEKKITDVWDGCTTFQSLTLKVTSKRIRIRDLAYLKHVTISYWCLPTVSFPSVFPTMLANTARIGCFLHMGHNILYNGYGRLSSYWFPQYLQLWC